MSYLFFIDEKNNKVLHPDVVSLVPELALLDEKELMFIILCYDYNSPLRQFPEEQRVGKAIWRAYGDNVPALHKDKRSERIKKAIEAYKSLQYNRNIELIELYNRKIDEQMQILEGDSSVSGNKNALENIDRFKKSIKAIEAEVVEEKLLDGELKGKVRLSFLEKMQSNINMYNSVIAKKG